MKRPDSITPKTQKIWQVGTLRYTRGKLIWVFFWLLLGDFAMSVMAMALPKLLPLQLDAMGIQADRIGWALSLGPLASLTLSPFIGVWSDRLRTRWGRRRPFLITTTPILAAGLILMPHITSYSLLCVVILIVQICNVLETVLFYLYADVMPPHLMGRFMAAFRIVGTFGGLCFQYFLMPQFDHSPVMVWTICGVSYLALYQVSLHCVREGEYPPPPAEPPKQMVRDYVKDGFGTRYIWLFWLTLGMCALAMPASIFADLFSKNNLKLDMTAIGHMNAYAMIPALLLSLPVGWLIDRYKPPIVWTIACTYGGLVILMAFFWVHNAMTMQGYYIAKAIFDTVAGVALMPMLYFHLPKAKFGQLVSTQSVVVQSMIFLSTNISGGIIGAMGNNYRIAFLYSGPFLLL